jgi:hypothetical protein
LVCGTSNGECNIVATVGVTGCVGDIVGDRAKMTALVSVLHS